MRGVRYWQRRLGNGIRKVASGLRPFNESVWPGVRNLLALLPWEITLFHHRFIGSGPLPDFMSPYPSKLSPSDFSLSEGTVEEAYRSCPFTAVFVARRTVA